MTRNFGLVVPALLAFGLMAYACTSGEVVEGPLTGTAGSTGAGPGSSGTTGSGAGPGSSGTTGSGARGGTTGAAAGPGSSGTTGSGARGGTTGAAGRGGTTGSGAGPGSSGTTGTAGTVGTAGTTGAGGTGTGVCPASFTVSSNGFVQMPVSGGGCFSGYPYTYADSYGTMVMPAPMAMWTTNMLKMTGNIVAVSGTNYSYAGLGFSIGQTSSGTPTLVSPTGNGLTFNVTNSTTGAGVVIRAQVTNGTTTWCKDMTTFPATIPYDGFTVNCYTAGGAKYAKEPIKGIEVNIAGGTAPGNINLTINSITEN